MIIRDNNKEDLKGTMLRGFNNTPSNIRDQINKANMMMKKFNEKQNDKLEKEQTPLQIRETLKKIDRINK